MKRLAISLLVAAIGVLASTAGWLAFSLHHSSQPPEEIGEVLIVTNRHMTENPDPAARFDGRRGALRHLRCEVGYRPIPLTDDVAGRVNFFVPTDFQKIEAVELLPADAFESAIAADATNPVVLFVHGYYYGFEKTCRMGVALQRMLQDNATVVMFSWPSDANPADYVADQADVEWSAPTLADLMQRLRTRVGPDRLRVVAHSLGTRGVLFALGWLGLEGKSGPVADHLVLLAPDYDATAFSRQFEHIRKMIDRVTLYASTNDTPLLVSQTLHGYPRLGRAGEHLTVIEGMETVDVSGVGRYHPTGHEYFFYHPVVAADLVELLSLGTPAGERAHTRSRSRDGLAYWMLERSESSRLREPE